MNLANCNYSKTMAHLNKLQVCALITTGRTGSDFLQSLLDNHTEILTFNGIFWFHNFWEKSKCVQYAGKDSTILNDLLDEFFGFFIEKFKSKYDYLERKDCLGIDGNKVIDIDLKKFKTVVINLLKNEYICSKSFMLAVYGGYAICLNQDLNKKKILVHHIHHVEKLPDYIEDFPNSKILCMTRDPRANFVSGIIHHREYSETTDNERHLLYYIKRIITDAYSADKFSKNVMVLKIEDLGKKCILMSLCSWLGVRYEDAMTKSTWAGLMWHGDRISKKYNTEIGFSKKMLQNNWNQKMTTKDKYIFNFIMNDRLINYEYEYKKIHIYDWLIVTMIMFLPLKFELSFFSINYFKKHIKNKDYKVLIMNNIQYARRVIFFYLYYFRKISGFKFYRKYIKCD